MCGAIDRRSSRRGAPGMTRCMPRARCMPRVRCLLQAHGVVREVRQLGLQLLHVQNVRVRIHVLQPANRIPWKEKPSTPQALTIALAARVCIPFSRPRAAQRDAKRHPCNRVTAALLDGRSAAVRGCTAVLWRCRAQQRRNRSAAPLNLRDFWHGTGPAAPRQACASLRGVWRALNVPSP